MNYRKGDIIEFEDKDGKLLVGRIVDFSVRGGSKSARVIEHDAVKKEKTTKFSRWSYKSSSYPTIYVNLDKIKKVIMKAKGKGYKKKFDIILIDEHGNVTDK